MILLTLWNFEQKNGQLVKLFCFSSDFDETVHPFWQDFLERKKDQPIRPLGNVLGIFLWLKIAQNEILWLAIYEGRWYTGKKIRQIWQNGLCVLADISKTANHKISFWAILSHRNIPKTFPKGRIGWFFSLWAILPERGVLYIQFEDEILRDELSWHQHHLLVNLEA